MLNPDEVEVISGADPAVDAAEEEAEVESTEVETTEPESTEVETTEVEESEEETDEEPEITPEVLQAKLAELDASIKKAEETEKQAREKAKYWREQARDARADYFRPQDDGERPPPKEQQKPPAQAAGRPEPENFQTLDAYYEALSDWQVSQRLQQWQEQQEQAGFFQKLEDFRENTVTKGMEKYEDFDEIAQDPTLPLTASMLELMMDLESPHDVAYYLGRNPHECLKVSRMPPVQAARELVRIESKIAAEEASNPPIESPNKKPVASKAPPPVKPIKGKGAKVSHDPEKMSYEEYRAWRESGGDI